MSSRELMYFSSMKAMLSVLVIQICSHISGEAEAILVMSLKPPAAICFMVSRLSSESLTRFTRLEATTWGRWLMAATARSWSFGAITMGMALTARATSTSRSTFSWGAPSGGVII